MASAPSRRYGLGPRRTWLALTLGLAVLGALEVAVGLLIVHTLVPDPWATGIDVVLIVGTAATLVVVASPMTGHVHIGEDMLVVRLGFLGGVRVRRYAVLSAAVEVPVPSHPTPLGLGIDHVGVMTVSRGGTPHRLRIRLAGSHPARHQVLRRADVSELVIDMADPHNAADHLSTPA